MPTFITSARSEQNIWRAIFDAIPSPDKVSFVPETGCDHYADWWEVLAEDGTLLYRRVLTHSHPDEQPFTRSGGPVDIGSDQVVWVRAHMNTSGFGGQAFLGSVATGLEAAQLPFDFAPWTATARPLPDGCDF